MKEVFKEYYQGRDFLEKINRLLNHFNEKSTAANNFELNIVKANKYRKLADRVVLLAARWRERKRNDYICGKLPSSKS